MPTSPSSSIDLPDPYVTASDPEPLPELAPLKWRLPVVLFVTTVASILVTAALVNTKPDEPFRLANGVAFAAPLLAILLTHEFAHFIFARHHRVNASLPFFIPLPLVNPFGTMGAVILMRDRIKSKNALLDIGASGPIAGMVVAIPVLIYGLARSEVHPLVPGGTQEGQNLLYLLLKLVTVGPIPDGSDVYLHPIALAGWVGLFITMLNLLPVGQLDGGHVAYALFGSRQNTYSKVVRWSLLVMVPINFFWQIVPVFRGVAYEDLFHRAVSASAPWFVWFVVLTLLERLGGGGHPPTEPGTLSPGRRVVAIGTLVLFVLLFMPAPWISD
jgi:membrane-associated protease RseP (regulator of RpoE activity)